MPTRASLERVAGWRHFRSGWINDEPIEMCYTAVSRISATFSTNNLSMRYLPAIVRLLSINVQAFNTDRSADITHPGTKQTGCMLMYACCGIDSLGMYAPKAQIQGLLSRVTSRIQDISSALQRHSRSVSCNREFPQAGRTGEWVSIEDEHTVEAVMSSQVRKI